MPILSHVGRRQPAQKAAKLIIYLLTLAGALCIVYPLLMVVGQTLSDDFDLQDNAIIPAYLYDRNALALKYIFSFSKNRQLLASRYHCNQWVNISDIRADKNFYERQPAAFKAQGLALDAWRTIVGDLHDYIRTMDPDNLMAVNFRIEDYYRPFLRNKYIKAADDLMASIAQGQPAPEWVDRMFPAKKTRQAVLTDRERLGLAIMNNYLQTDYLNFYSVKVVPPGNFAVPVWRPPKTPLMTLWHEFVLALPAEQKMIIPSDAYWHEFLRNKYVNIDTLNTAWGTSHKGFFELVLSFCSPSGAGITEDWNEFIIKRWPRRLLIVPAGFSEEWRHVVKKKYTALVGADAENVEAKALAEFNKRTGLSLGSWKELELPQRLPENDVLRRYWCEFTFTGIIAADAMKLDAPEVAFRAFLRNKYGGDRVEQAALANLNHAWKSSFTSFDQVPLPLCFTDYCSLHFNTWNLRLAFAVESYKRVSDYLAHQSQAWKNTFILVILNLIAALTINPMAAYALSRFPMKSSHKIMLFFLATMAFPAEVTMIPNFLLLRDFHLLNTYAALVLPTIANGFSIFLLKGFFDSLPKELFEAADIDGASELQIFWIVALPLLKPIMAYIGLNTFVSAYNGFMWAFVICPKEEMWTLMVWIYDFQSRNPGNNYIMAATVLVSIPPLLAFLFANRLIMRGIIIPTMK